MRVDPHDATPADLAEAVNVIVNDAELDETKKAQIENVVKRKTGIAAKNITITPTNNQ